MYENIPEVMTLKECCEILHVGKNTMLDLLHTNQIEGFKRKPRKIKLQVQRKIKEA